MYAPFGRKKQLPGLSSWKKYSSWSCIKEKQRMLIDVCNSNINSEYGHDVSYFNLCHSQNEGNISPFLVCNLMVQNCNRFTARSLPVTFLKPVKFTQDGHGAWVSVRFYSEGTLIVLIL